MWYFITAIQISGSEVLLSLPGLILCIANVSITERAGFHAIMVDLNMWMSIHEERGFVHFSYPSSTVFVSQILMLWCHMHVCEGLLNYYLDEGLLIWDWGGPWRRERDREREIRDRGWGRERTPKWPPAEHRTPLEVGSHKPWRSWANPKPRVSHLTN